IKIARLFTRRHQVIVPFRAHLGQTLAMVELSGFSKLRKALPGVEARALNVPDPYCARCFYRQTPDSCGFLCIDRIDDFLEYAGCGEAACMIIEPISGVGGNIVPPTGYLATLKEFCKDRGILLIFDENQTSLGRTGHMFAAETFNVEPDIITLSKGLTGSDLPLAAILMEERLAILDRSLHGFTFGAGNLASAAALTALDVIRRPGFLENVRKAGTYLLARLSDTTKNSAYVFEVRGVGLMLGVELCEVDKSRSPALAQALHAALMRNGLITRISEQGRGNVIELRPPLILEMADADEIVGRWTLAMRDIV